METAQFGMRSIEEIAIMTKIQDIDKFSNLLIYKTDNNCFTSYYAIKQIKETEKAIQFQFISNEIEGNTPLSTKPILAKHILFSIDDFQNSVGNYFWLPKTSIKFKTENFRYGGNLITNTNVFSKPFWLK